jgi:hypothetical protein
VLDELPLLLLDELPDALLLDDVLPVLEELPLEELLLDAPPPPDELLVDALLLDALDEEPPPEPVDEVPLSLDPHPIARAAAPAKPRP